ncbi:ABC transporter ATP-binding protein [Candidatus Rhodobacter oscarellae]|nr:ABC transporter ATP-binding protein [Candidatus Rhodobacter lobularis]
MKRSEQAKERRRFFQDPDRENLHWVWRTYLKQKTPWMIVMLVLIVGQGVVYQQFLALTEGGLRVIFENGTVAQLLWVSAVVFAIFVLRGFLSFATPRISAWLTSEIVLEIRKDIISNLLRLDLAYFDRTNSGEIIHRVVAQANALGTFLGQTSVIAVREAVTVLVVSGYLIYKSPLLFAAALIAIPSVALSMQFVGHRIRSLQIGVEKATSDYVTNIEEMSSGMRTVKITGQEEYEQDRLFNASGLIRTLNYRLLSTQALIPPLIDLITAFVFVIVIAGGGYLILTDTSGMDAAGLITFLLGLAILFDPIRAVANYFAQLQGILVMLDSVCAHLKLNSALALAENPEQDIDTQSDFVLEDVTFGYEGEEPLFRDLSLRLKGGEVTAVVGPTGSGKTTILSLLTRLYDVGDGKITLGDADVKDLDLERFRKSFSVVAQDIVIFNDTIKENIRYARTDASDEEIWAAAEAAEIAPLMRSRGDTPLGPKGSQLSGGQKQRIAIARAFLNDAPIVLLDEATSALDQGTEDRIQAAMQRLTKNKTTVVVSHRLSSVMNADQIYFLENGTLIEGGTHEELLQRDGLYAAMFTAQKQGYD